MCLFYWTPCAGSLEGFVGFCESEVAVLAFKVRSGRVKSATLTRFTEHYIMHLTAGVCLCFEVRVGLKLAHYVAATLDYLYSIPVPTKFSNGLR